MKKHLSILTMAVIALALCGCEDVPAPYQVNTEGGSSTTILSESFASSLGKFVNYTTAGGGEWVNDYSTAKASGYDNSSKVTTPGTYYLVSPEIDLTDVDSAYITYDYILQYNQADENQQCVITDNFDVNNPSSGWETLKSNHTVGSDWSTFYNAAINIPEYYYGKKVRIALYYSCGSSSSTWEVKNFKVIRGKVNEEEPTPQPVAGNYLPFTSSSLKDGFSTQLIEGSNWSLGSTYAKATGYNSGTTTASKAWLISPSVNTAVDSTDPVYMTFDYVLRYVSSSTDINGYHKVLASANYTGDVTTTDWTVLDFEPKESATQDWTFYASNSIEIPSELINQEDVVFAFYFECNSTNSTTWELKNLSIRQGGEDPTPTPTPTPTGDNLIANGDFETWSGGAPACWKSASTASSATLAQSTSAHSGSYAVQVQGSTSANKRLAYQEITLKAGTYNMKFYAKGDGAEASVRPGYVPVESGKVGSYAYGDYVDNISSTEWTEVNHSFTLLAETTLCLVIMNPKSTGTNVLIDDFELTTSDGGGGNTEPADEGIKTVTVAEFNAAAESTTVWYQLTGTVSGLTDGDLYGNFDLTDSTGSVYVYGLLSEKGGSKKLFQQLVEKYNLQDGMTITIIGNRSSFNSKIEVANAYLVSVQN